MTAQRYSDSTARQRMAVSTCPECGGPALEHSPDNRFWVRDGCSLMPRGVESRIEQYRADIVVPGVTREADTNEH